MTNEPDWLATDQEMALKYCYQRLNFSHFKLSGTFSCVNGNCHFQNFSVGAIPYEKHSWHYKSFPNIMQFNSLLSILDEKATQNTSRNWGSLPLLRTSGCWPHRPTFESRPRWKALCWNLFMASAEEQYIITFWTSCREKLEEIRSHDL